MDNFMKGLAYVFLRKDGAPLVRGWAGHVGWGFLVNEEGALLFGSTENDSGQPYLPPGSNNGWWSQRASSEAEMIEVIAERNYDAYKVATVRNCDPKGAELTAIETGTRGYIGTWNNCLDHTWDILAAYGVRDLALAQMYPTPNQWFAMVNGEYRNI